MVGFKAKAKASAYFTKLGWRRGCVFVNGECVWGVGLYVYMAGVVWMCKKGENVLERGGEEKLHHFILFVTLSSLVCEKFYPINLIKMTKIENKNCKYSK